MSLVVQYTDKDLKSLAKRELKAEAKRVRIHYKYDGYAIVFDENHLSLAVYGKDGLSRLTSVFIAL